MSAAAGMTAELERAAEMLLGPPHLITPHQRQEAENIFLSFRQTKCPYTMCKQLLETSKSDYVLFEASGLIKDALIREWNEIPTDEIGGMRAYLLQYVVNNPGCSGFVRERIVQVIAIMVKRQSVEDSGADRATVIKEVQQLITSGNQQMQMMGCAIITALMQEYATTVKSSDVGLAWEIHFKVKKQFEVTDLRTIFKFSVAALRELSARIVLPISGELEYLLRRLVVISETVLSWTFINVNLPKKLISVFEADISPSLRPGLAWKEIIVEPGLTTFMFDLHWRVRSSPSIAHHTLNCLVQLATLNGQTLNVRDLRLEYLTNYVRSFTQLIENVGRSGAMPGKEALAVSTIVRKLVLFYPPNILVNIEAELLHKYLEQLVSLTCGFLSTSMSQDGDEEERVLFNEAFENIMEAWLSILHDSQLFPTTYCKEAAAAIFKTFLQVHLAAPEGTRNRSSDSVDDDDDENEQSDRVRYRDTLSTIGALGRQCLDYSLPAMISLLENKITRLHAHIQRVSSQGATELDAVLSDLFEDVHWVLLISGNVLSLDVDGETAIIPTEIMHHSIAQAATVDISKSLEVLASPGKPVSQISGYESADHVVRLLGDVFRLIEVEKRAMEAGLVHLWSPLVASSLMWFLRRWSLTYLATQEAIYQEISSALVTAFGRDTDGAKWTVNFLLDKCLSNLTRFNSQHDVLEDTIGLILSFADSKEKCSTVCQSNGLLSILQLGVQQNTLPSVCKRGLFKALVLVGSAQEDANSRDQYWNQVLKPLEDRYQAIVENPNLKTIYTEESVRSAIIDLLESLTGVVQGCQASTVHQLFGWMRPTISSLVQLLGLYHNYNQVVELILELYCEIAKRILCYFTPAESKAFYQASLAMIKMYADHQAGRRCYSKEAEEEQYRDILLFMELLTNLLSKDFIDLSPPDSEDTEDNITAADVCLYGLNIIMPLMSEELLKFPSLCLQYFKFITFLCEIFPEKVTGLPSALQQSLVTSLHLGLTSLGVDPVFSLCCDFIQVLGCYMVRNQVRDTPIYEQMRSFLKLFLDLILSHQINSDILPNSSATLYVLICLYRETYEQLVQILVQSQDDSNKERLALAFTRLTMDTPLTAERIHRIRFRDAFDKFIVNVRGFLFVK